MKGPRGARAISLVLAFAALVAVSVFVLRGTAAGDGPRRLVLLTLDTTRADRLGCYGYAHATTPNLDRLAREGALFRDVTSTSPTTLPAHASILTGLFPPSHGARNNGNFVLVPEVTTLAEILQKEGIPTAAFVAAAVLQRTYGLDQGFDEYDDDLLDQAFDTSDGYRHQRAEQVIAKALRWLEGVRSGEFFAWIHLFDPHAPYDSHPELPKSDPYDSEIAYMDAWIGHLLEALEGWRILDDTIVVAVADHGESLGEKGEATHGFFLYQATLRVPLLIRAPALVERGTEITHPVSTVDLMPTLLSFMRLAPPAVQGRTLETLLEGRDDSHPRTIYFETLLPRFEYLWANLAGIRRTSSKFIEAPTPELYELSSDPAEEHNLLPGVEDEVAEWRQHYAGVASRLAPPSSEAEISISAEAEASLRALGYGFAPIQVGESQDLPDPKDQVELMAHYVAIQEAWSRLEWSEVVRLTEVGLRARPVDVYQAVFAARAKARLGFHREAEGVYRRILELVPEDPLSTRGLAASLFEMKRYEEAIDVFRRALEIEPLQALNHIGLAEACLAIGERDEARRLWKEALEVDPYIGSSANSLGALSAQEGDFTEAARYFDYALRVDPGNTSAASNLQGIAAAYTNRRAWQELLGLANGQLGRVPGDAVWSFHRARALEGVGSVAEAMSEYGRLQRASDLPVQLQGPIQEALQRLR